MSQFLVVTSHGLSKYLKKELKQIFDLESKIINETKVKINTSWEKAIEILRFGRGIARIVYLLDEFEFSDKNSLQKQIEKIPFEEFMNTSNTFAVRCSRYGKHDFKSPDIERWAGESIINRFERKKSKKIKVDLEHPDFIVRIYVMNEKAWLGLDLVGYLSLHNRWYRVKKHPAGLRSTIAFQLLLASEWMPHTNKNNKVLDPTTGSATIPIEAALWTKNYPVNDPWKHKFSINKWDFIPEKAKKTLQTQYNTKNTDHIVSTAIEKKQSFYNFAQINIKHASVEKNIELLKHDAFMMKETVNIEEHSAMVFNPPFGVRMGKKEYLEKLYDHLLNTAYEYSIPKIAFLTTKIGLAKKIAAKNHLEIKDYVMFLYGKINAYMIVIKQE